MSDKTRQDMKIAVLAGGISDEREISLASGAHVVQGLEEAGYGAVELVDPADPSFLNTMSTGSFDVAFIASMAAVARMA